jgi:hypothetical protein
MCFSSTTFKLTSRDSTVSITSEQLKYANLIFVEHDKLLKENDLLNIQVQNYIYKSKFLEKTDSLRLLQINSYKDINESYAKQVEDLNKKILKQKKTVTGWKIGGITVSAGLLLLLLLK